MTRRLSWLGLFAVAMAYLESAVVVYLRALYYPDGFSFPLVLIPPRMAAIEIGREAATIVMLLAVAWIAGDERWSRFAWFCWSFAVWDVFYYVWLRAMIGWPSSLLEWDVLFLIPVPWIGPVLAPVLVSLGLAVAALVLLRLRERVAALSFGWPAWIAAVAGGVLVLAAFMADFPLVLRGGVPPPFRWPLFLAGYALALASFAASVRRVARVRDGGAIRGRSR